MHLFFLCVCVFQDEDICSEALAMLDESSSCGSVQSSYLLWEKNRHMAVGSIVNFTSKFMLGGY